MSEKRVLVLAVLLIPLVLLTAQSPFQLPTGIAADQAATSITMTASPTSPSVSSTVTFTVTLHGTWHELAGVVTGKQIMITAWVAGNQCTTGSDGTCQVTLTTPSTVGSYLVSAQFSGDNNFLGSWVSMTLIVGGYSIAATVNLAYVRIVRVTVTLRQDSTVVARQTFTYSGRFPTHTFTFGGLMPGTYTVTVTAIPYIVPQSKTATVPPNQQVTFTI